MAKKRAAKNTVKLKNPKKPKKQKARKQHTTAEISSENPHPVLRIARDGMLLYANPASVPLLMGWRSRIGQHVPIEWRQLVEEILKSGLGENIEVEQLGGRIFSFVVVPVTEEGYVNLYGRDITERKKAEQKLREAYIKLKETQDQLVQTEKMRVVGALASGVAHEVKNPLGIVLQGINYLERKLESADGDTKETLELMKGSVKRADNIVCSLVDFAKATKLQTKSEDMNSVLDTSLGLIKPKIKEANIKVVKEFKEGLPKVIVDKGKMEQVFLNLFINAIHAIGTNGTLFVRTYATDIKEMPDAAEKGVGDYFDLKTPTVIVEVEDTGSGISEENLKKIFEPFFSTKGPREGAGLGLPVTKNIVEMHQGTLEVESEKDKGTKFIITLKVLG